MFFSYLYNVHFWLQFTQFGLWSAWITMCCFVCIYNKGKMGCEEKCMCCVCSYIWITLHTHGRRDCIKINHLRTRGDSTNVESSQVTGYWTGSAILILSNRFWTVLATRIFSSLDNEQPQLNHIIRLTRVGEWTLPPVLSSSPVSIIGVCCP